MLSHAAGDAPDDMVKAARPPTAKELEARLDALRRALSRAIARLDRRIDAVRGDLERAAGADETARRAQLFVAEASRAPRGAKRLVAVDWSSLKDPPEAGRQPEGPPYAAREIEMKLDPAKPARAQLDAVFQRARRLKDGARIGRARLAEAEAARASLAAIAVAMDRHPASGGGPGGPSLLAQVSMTAALEARARTAAPRDFKLAAPQDPSKRGSPSAQQAPLPPYRTFTSASGVRIMVGKGAEKNDELTFHVARPHDLWLHVKNRTGAHVIVPLARGHTCPGDVLVEAAHLAAHFSEARDEDLVEVQYARKRHLRKPRGSAPGLVMVDKEKVLVLRRQEALLKAVLAREIE